MVAQWGGADMDRLVFVLLHYCALAALAVCSYTFGRWLTRHVTYHSTLEQVCLSTALGLGAVSYLVFLLGLLNLLYRPVVLIALLVGFLLCFRIWMRWPGDLVLAIRSLRTTNPISIVISIGIAILIFGVSFYIWVLPLYPPTGFDSILYHLPAAKIYARTHGLVLLEHLRLPVFPQASHMLFTLALLVYDDILAQLVELLMLIVLLGTVVAFGQRMFSYRTGFWAAAILLAQPVVLWLGSVAYIDMGLTLYTTATVYAFWNWLESRQQHWLLLAGCFCGIGIGTKYSALFFLAALTLAAIFAGFKKRQWRPALIFAAVALLVAAPWFFRNFYYTRNPLFPLFDTVFAPVFGYGIYQANYYLEISEAFSSAELGRGWHLLLSLPWQLAFEKSKPFSLVGFLLLPLAVAFAVTNRRISFLLALTAGFTLCWFFAFQQFRYLLPVLPLMSIAVAAPVDHLIVRLPWKRLWNHKLITAAVSAVLIFPGWQQGNLTVRSQGIFPFTQQRRDAYLARAFPTYPIIKYLNDFDTDNYTVYVLYNENMTYFPNGQFIGDHFGRGAYNNFLEKLNSGESLYSYLKTMGVDYLVVPSHFHWVAGNKRIPIILPSDSFFQSHFKLIYSANDVQLFELMAVPLATNTSKLIRNPQVEELNNKKTYVRISQDKRSSTPLAASLRQPGQFNLMLCNWGLRLSNLSLEN